MVDEFVLDKVNWDFPGNLFDDRQTNVLFDARRHHWYPATFVPELPYTLIEELSNPGDRVLDPFAGIGTTVWQALLLGRNGIAVESNLIAGRLMTWFRRLLATVHWDPIISGLAASFAAYESGTDYRYFLTDRQRELLSPWFNEPTLNELGYIAWVLTCDLPTDMLAAIQIGASASLKTCNEQRRGWGCIADNMQPRVHSKDSREILQTICKRTAKLMRDLRRLHASTGRLEDLEQRATIVRGDFLDEQVAVPSDVDLIVTSPPYPVMTDYTTAQRLSFYWMGIEPEPHIQPEIGARRKRFRTSWPDEYVDEMTSAIQRMQTLLAPNAKLALVLPEFSQDSKLARLRNRCMQSIHSAVTDGGLSLAWKGARELPRNRRHNNQAWTRLKREHIYVYVS